METKETKICKHCQSEIPKKAKVCPNCRKKVKGGVLKWVVIVVAVIAIICIVTGGGEDSPETKTGTPDSSAVSKSAEDTEKDEITYEKYDVGTLVNDLEKNALKAADTYKDQYVELTGVVGTIDSSGDYICIEPAGEDFPLYNVQCYIQNEEQTKAAMEMEDGESVIVKGKITDVGEVLGYSLDLEGIEKAK